VLSLTVFAVGLELVGDRLLVYALSADGGQPVLVVDSLLEVSEADPLYTPAISRLLQERVRLIDLLRGALCLEQHPVQHQGEMALIRPDFEVRPRVQAVQPGAAGRWPELVIGALPKESGAVGVSLRLGRVGAEVQAHHEGVAFGLDESATLVFNLTKLALTEGTQTCPAVVRMRRGLPILLAVRHPSGETCFPMVDPRAMLLSAQCLSDRVCLLRDADALWLRALLVGAGAVDGALGRDLDACEPADFDQAILLARALIAVGRTVPAALEALAAASLVASSATGAHLIGAIWLLVCNGAVETRRTALELCWEKHLLVAPRQPAPEEIAARALLIDLLELAQRTDDDSPLLPPRERAVGYLDAHVSALRLAARSRVPKLPTLAQMAWLAEARVLLTGDFAAAPLEALDLPPDGLRPVLADALWQIEQRGDLAVAADAIWVAGLAGWTEHLFP
jgi:hypothetical protein